MTCRQSATVALKHSNRLKPKQTYTRSSLFPLFSIDSKEERKDFFLSVFHQDDSYKIKMIRIVLIKIKKNADGGKRAVSNVPAPFAVCVLFELVCVSVRTC